MRTRFVLMTFGDDAFRYWQGAYCVLALLGQTPEPRDIVMATDRPEWFRWFGSALRVEAFDAERLARWQGPHRYFLRTLIETLRLGTTLDPEPDVVVYMDTDTIARRDLGELITAVAEGAIVMDRKEHNLSGGRSRRKRDLWNQVGNRSWEGFRIDHTTDMWNSGITALARSDFPLVEAALRVNDAMLDAGCRHYLIEQAAMSAVLTSTGRVREANPPGRPALIDHYWGNKDGYNESIAQDLATIYQRGFDVAAAVAYVRDHPIRRPLLARRRWWHALFAGLAGNKR